MAEPLKTPMDDLDRFSVLFYFYLVKNSIITNNISGNILKILNLKKIIIYLLFFIFAFSWNIKTVITEDVGSFPIYRIPYKIFKLLNTLGKFFLNLIKLL